MATRHSIAAAAAPVQALSPEAVAAMAEALALDAHLLLELIDQLVCGTCENSGVQLSAARAVAAGMGAMSDRLARGHGGDALYREPVQWQLVEKDVLDGTETQRAAYKAAKATKGA